MIIFIAIPSAGTVKDGTLTPDFLKRMAELVADMPQHTFISPMIQDYALLPYMPAVEATWEVWGAHCRRLIEVCDEVWVLTYPGWAASVGVTGEVNHATYFGKTVRFLDVE
jgi:hypothetical protein